MTKFDAGFLMLVCIFLAGIVTSTSLIVSFWVAAGFFFCVIIAKYVDGSK